MGWQQADKHQMTADRRPIPDGTYVNNVRIGPPEDPTVRIGPNRGIDMDISMMLEKGVINIDPNGVGIFDEDDLVEPEPEPPRIRSRMAMRVPKMHVDSNGLEIK